MGEKGLARRGWLVKMGQKLYALTRDGRQVVRRLLSDGGEPAAGGAAVEPVKLSRDQEKFLQGLFASSAVEKFQEGRKQELTFADATRFWGITENLRGEALDARMDRLRASLADLDRLLGAGSTTLSNGRAVTGDDLGLLCDVHAYLEDRFARHLTLLRNRTDRN
jgi:DNA-binding PadR family transcriptional regulator